MNTMKNAYTLSSPFYSPHRDTISRLFNSYHLASYTCSLGSTSVPCPDDLFHPSGVRQLIHPDRVPLLVPFVHTRKTTTRILRDVSFPRSPFLPPCHNTIPSSLIRQYTASLTCLPRSVDTSRMRDHTILLPYRIQHPPSETIPPTSLLQSTLSNVRTPFGEASIYLETFFQNFLETLTFSKEIFAYTEARVAVISVTRLNRALQ